MTRRQLRLLPSLVALLLAVALGLAPVGATAATTVGTDLSRPANATFTCAAIPAGSMLMPSGAASCTHFTTSASLFSSAESDIVPAGFGVITKVRVKTGPQVGPMQVVTFRSTRQSQSTGAPGCCWPQYATNVFTPSPNTTTEIATQLPVINVNLLSAYLPMPGTTLPSGPNTDPYGGIHEAPTGIQSIQNYDQIALSVLGNSTPIPAQYDGSDAYGGMFFPAISTGAQLSLSGSWNGIFGTATRGMHVLLQATWEPDADHDGLGDETQDPQVGEDPGGGNGGGNGGGTAPAADTTPPTVTLAVASKKLSRALSKGLEVRVSCSEACQATTVLRRGKATVGQGVMGFAAAGRQTQYITLGKSTRRALRHARKATLTLITTAKDAAGNVGSATTKATLRR